MHPNSMKLMKYFRDRYLLDMKGATVLDVGAMDMQSGRMGSYRSLFKQDFRYRGMDVEPGPNIDIVGYENIKGIYDVVISGQTMEHVKRPWEWLKSLTGYYREFICIIAPNTWGQHRYPIDTYRYFPDGMRDLFEYAGIKELEIFMRGKDTIGIGAR